MRSGSFVKLNMKTKIKTSGQIWIETVLYTLIGLSLIGLALAFITPKITEAKDRLVVEQTINSLNTVDERINAVLQAAGNRRILEEFTMKRGELYVNSSGDEIAFVINGLKKPYSQPGVEISVGRIKVLSQTGQKTSTVSLTLKYDINITYAKEDVLKKFDASATPYKFSVENLGDINKNGIEVVSIEEISGR